MARFGRLEVLNTMVQTGLIPVFYNKDIGIVKNVVQAASDGGGEPRK